jgi:hypothetical protein
MFSSANFKDSCERAVAAFCQTLLALVGTDGAGMLEVGLTDSVKAAAVAGLLSVLKSFAAIKGPIGGANPSMVDLDQQP